jgi:hypothetical protein
MKTLTSLILATPFLFALPGCDQRTEPTDKTGGNGSETFIPDVEAARARDVSELKKHNESSNHQHQQQQKQKQKSTSSD